MGLPLCCDAVCNHFAVSIRFYDRTSGKSRQEDRRVQNYYDVTDYARSKQHLIPYFTDPVQSHILAHMLSLCQKLSLNEAWPLHWRITYRRQRVLPTANDKLCSYGVILPILALPDIEKLANFINRKRYLVLKGQLVKSIFLEEPRPYNHNIIRRLARHCGGVVLQLCRYEGNWCQWIQ